MQKIKRSNWSSNFTLVGQPVIQDWTFKMDAVNANGNWCYNTLSLDVDCGDKHGTVRAEMMGGYSTDPSRESIIYAHGKKDNGDDDFKNSIKVAWDDRFNDDILAEIGDLSFIVVGIEKTTKGDIFKKYFLSEYDAIAYIQKHLTSDMVIRVNGVLEYSEYKGQVQVRKKINEIVLSKIDSRDKYYARFVQSFLLDSESATKDCIDKSTGIMTVNARVLDYVKMVGDVEYKGQYPYNICVDFEMPMNNEAQCKALLDKVFKVKRGVTQMTWQGDFIENGATVKTTVDDVPDEIKELIGITFEEDEVLATCATNGNKVRRMVLRKPHIKLVGENKTPTLQKFEEQYTEEELILDIAPAATEDDEELPFDMDENVGNDYSWLS